jgi:transcriptional regulator with XRE-family HTH domain
MRREGAELDRSFISLVERGIQSPNLVVLFKIAGVLGVSAAEMLAKTEALLHVRSPPAMQRKSRK